MTALTYRNIPAIAKSYEERAKRGDIISADGFHVATAQKLYKAIVNTASIDAEKKELFVTLFSIYSGLDPKEIREKLSQKGRVTLSYRIDSKSAKHMNALAHQLLKLKVFKRFSTGDGKLHLHGLDIIQSGEARSYPYGNLLTPILGYIHKYDEQDDYTRVNGIKGIEKSYQSMLEDRTDGIKTAERDVNNYLILNKKSTLQSTQNGPDVILNIPLSLQAQAEKIVSIAQEKFGAKEVMCAVMESHTGKILMLASSNRFNPKAIRKQDYSALNTNAIEYSFEPGSVLKPIIFAKLLDNKKINPLEVINTHNGIFKIGKKTITDEHGYAYLSAENVIVHSSNIGMAQMVQKLGAIDIYQHLIDMGFTRASGLDLPYENSGFIPSVVQLNSEIYKATLSYGYGMQANFMQLLKAYNVFNNFGLMVEPKVVGGLVKQGRMVPLSNTLPEQALSEVTAERVKKILIKTVKEGTGVGAHYAGLEIGGKTGTAHIAEGGVYIRKYNSSFFGFANDDQKRYTIGVTVIEPNKHTYFAATSAVPVFFQLTKLLVELDYLHPSN